MYNWDDVPKATLMIPQFHGTTSECIMFKGRKIRETPFIVRVFDKYIQAYSVNKEGMIFAQPRTPSIINSLTFRSMPVGILGFGETKWYVTAVHEIVGRDQMNSETANFYRRLKGMECEVEVKGTITKKVIFKPNRSLNKLKPQIPALQISDRLCKILERNTEIADLIKAIKPVEMSIGLHSIPELLQIPGEHDNSIDPVIQRTIYYFNNPTSITWIATLSTLFQELPFVQNKAKSVIRLFSEIFQTIKRELHSG
jgi:hypothetical protein